VRGCEYAAPTVPPGSEVVEIATAEETVMVSCFCAEVVPSATFTVNGYWPAVVGVPAIRAPESVRPGGSGPVAIDQI
jgi:hypothetical protein